MATVTPNYNWSVPTSTDYVAQGAVAIETLGDSVDATLFTALGGAYPGLRLVKKQVIGSAVSQVVVTDAFSATYPNYKIIVSGGVGSGQAYAQLRLGSTTSNYFAGYLGFTYASTPSNAGVSGGVNFPFSIFTDAAGGMNGSVELLQPFTTSRTFMNSACATNNQSIIGQGQQTDNTSFTAFTLIPATGTLTGGTIHVYGYGAS